MPKIWSANPAHAIFLAQNVKIQSRFYSEVRNTWETLNKLNWKLLSTSNSWLRRVKTYGGCEHRLGLGFVHIQILKNAKRVTDEGAPAVKKKKTLNNLRSKERFIKIAEIY